MCIRDRLCRRRILLILVPDTPRQGHTSPHPLCQPVVHVHRSIHAVWVPFWARSPRPIRCVEYPGTPYWAYSPAFAVAVPDIS
eukprot:2373904-Rhodomonas_salina.1